MIADDLDTLDAQQLREALRAARADAAFKQAVIDKLTHENATLKRLRFAATREPFTPEQRSLLEDTLDADIEAVQVELARMGSVPPVADKQVPRRKPLPPGLPRREVHHEPESTVCACGCQMKRIGEDVAEKLDYQPGVFSVERHIRGKWACVDCERLSVAGSCSEASSTHSQASATR